MTTNSPDTPASPQSFHHQQTTSTLADLPTRPLVEGENGVHNKPESMPNSVNSLSTASTDQQGSFTSLKLSHSLPARPTSIPPIPSTCLSTPNLKPIPNLSHLPPRPQTLLPAPHSKPPPTIPATIPSSLPLNPMKRESLKVEPEESKPFTTNTSSNVNSLIQPKREEEEIDSDRKPSLPVPYPFASTSAPISLIDSRRDSFALPSTSTSRSNSPRASRSNSGSITPVTSSRMKKEELTSASTSDEGDESESKKEVKVSPKKKSTGNGKGKGKGKGKRGEVESEPQLIGHLPSAEEAAGKTYTEIGECSYFSKQLGNVPYYDPENSRCDCTYRSGEPDSEQACGEYSNCMNRMMQIECEAGDCRCGGKCQNQRFQNKEYAPIEIVKTEKKGFGVRATQDLGSDAFIYEYVGEVIGPAPFARKMKDYAQEGIKHFYFMALDKEVFIDATKKGGKGRFLNHSCNPNCQVAKWTVGKKMRMGIFSKREIMKNEELTFNYNVDRYGHVAQECFCGEPNCVGFIGGKTQTDIGGMDDLYIDALGIAEEVEALGLKGTKKKKGKKLDEDFNPVMTPIPAEDVPKVSSAIRQALQTRRILEKLLQRVNLTEDEEVQRQLLRLHGLSLMNNILREYPKDNEVIMLDLQILQNWKFQTRNKIETSKIEDQLKKFVDYEDAKIANMAEGLLASWSELTLGFRIPKAQRDANDEADLKRPSHFDIEQLSKRARIDESPTQDTEPFDRSIFVRPEANNVSTPLARPRKLPPGWSVIRGEDGREHYRNDYTGASQWVIPSVAAEPPQAKQVQVQAMDANALIAEAERAAKEAREEESRRVAEEKKERDREKEERHRRKKEEKIEKERAQKEKKVMGLFSGVVVSTMSKYRSQFEAEAFKKRAKEVTQILLDKEKKRPTYDEDAYETLSAEKETKVKSFVKDWVKKLLERKKGGRSSSSSTPRPVSSSSKPRPTLSTENSSSSTPRLQGLDFDSPATPQTVQMDIDTPTTNGDKNGDSTSGGGTPPGSPPSRSAQPYVPRAII